jgi:hypothetical protein
MFKTKIFKLFATILMLSTQLGCRESNSLDWEKLTRLTDPTSFQSALKLNDGTMSLMDAGLDQYKTLMRTRTTENHERAKVLYSRIQMHAGNSVVLAGDFNRLAELEFLHLGWAKSLMPPYTQLMENRIRSFEASSAIYLTVPFLRPANPDRPERKSAYYTDFDDTLIRLNELCLIATNPWQLNYDKAAAPVLAERVRKMSADFIQSMKNMSVVPAGKHATSIPFSQSTYAKAFSKMCAEHNK